MLAARQSIGQSRFPSVWNIMLSKLAIFEKHMHILAFNCEPVNADNVRDTINL